MGIFSTDTDDRKNTVQIDNTNDIKIESTEILTVLIIIAVLIGVLVLLRIVSLIKKATKRQADRDNILLNRVNRQ